VHGASGRRGHGLSIEELLGDYGEDAVAHVKAKFGIDPVRWPEWRSGRKPPGLRSAEELANLLDTSSEEIRKFDTELVQQLAKDARFDEPLGWLRWPIDKARERWQLRWGDPP
jgi:hypothetical protein